jgi:transposase
MDKMDKIDNTGLTPKQKKAAVLLASGKSMTETAKEVKIERSTLYQWAEKANFKAYYNSLVKELQTISVNSLFGLADKAFEVLRESLKAKNENVRLKAALNIIDRIKNVKVGETDPVQMLRKECTISYDAFNIFNNVEFNKERFERLLKENNLSE